MNLRLRYSIRRQTHEGLYDVIDADTEEYACDEPMPYEEALIAKKNAENLLTATEKLADAFGWLAMT
jgi:hypothetical protein